MKKEICYWLSFFFVIPFLLTGFAFYLAKLAFRTGYGYGKDFEKWVS